MKFLISFSSAFHHIHYEYIHLITYLIIILDKYCGSGIIEVPFTAYTFHFIHSIHFTSFHIECNSSTNISLMCNLLSAVRPVNQLTKPEVYYRSFTTRPGTRNTVFVFLVFTIRFCGAGAQHIIFTLCVYNLPVSLMQLWLVGKSISQQRLRQLRVGKFCSGLKFIFRNYMLLLHENFAMFFLLSFMRHTQRNSPK